MNNVSFNIEAITLDKANQKAMSPDKNGVYKGLVLQVIGAPSRNGKLYEPTSMTDAIVNPNSCFYKKLIAGQAYGEAGHPIILNENEISRIATIDMSRVSHAVLKVYTGEPTEKGHVVVYGDIKPYGPYKDMLIESLESSVLNTAFSLRSLVEKIGETSEGYINQKVMALISYDFVDCPGYAAASKVHHASDESFNYEINAKNKAALEQLVSQEVITDHQLEDILGMDKVTILHNKFDIANNDFIHNGRQIDIFHTMFNH